MAGLLNVYKFQNTITPLLANRFKVTFYTENLKPYGDAANGGGKFNPSFDVKNIDLPTWKIESSDSRKRFGNTQFVIPLFDFASSGLKITFIESETMRVTEFLNSLLFTAGNYWSINIPSIIQIQIDEYDYAYRQKVNSKIYACRPKNISQPNFSNTAKGEPIEITAEFNIVYELNRLIENIKDLPESVQKMFNKDELNKRIQEADEETSSYQKSLTALNTDLRRQAQELETKRQAAKKKFFDDMQKRDNKMNDAILKNNALIQLNTIARSFWNSDNISDADRAKIMQEAALFITSANSATIQVNGKTVTIEALTAGTLTNEEIQAVWDQLSEDEQNAILVRNLLGVNVSDGIDENEKNNIMKALIGSVSPEWRDENGDLTEQASIQIVSVVDGITAGVDNFSAEFNKYHMDKNVIFQEVMAAGGDLMKALANNPELKKEWDKLHAGSSSGGGGNIDVPGGGIAGMGASAFLEMSKDWGYNYGGKLAFDSKTGEALWVDLVTTNKNDVLRAQINGTTKGIDCNGFVAALLTADGASGSLLAGNGKGAWYGKDQVIEHDGPVEGGVKGINTYASAGTIYNDLDTPGKQPTLNLSGDSIIKDVWVKGSKGDAPGHIVAEVEIDGERYIVESAGSVKNNGVRRTKKDEWMKKYGSSYKSMDQRGLITRT